MDPTEPQWLDAAARAGTDAIRVEAAPEELERRGLAEMDVATPPAIVEALRRRVDHPVFGYTGVSAASVEGLAAWLRRRGEAPEAPAERLLQLGVGPRTALEVVVRATFGPGDEVVVPVPTYRGLLSAVGNSGARVLPWPLTTGRDGVGLDLERLATLVGHHAPHGFAWCSPSNPLGRVFGPDEVEAVLGCVASSPRLRSVVADEVHADLVHPGHVHGQTARAAERHGVDAVVVGSLAKLLNVSGLGIAYCVAATGGRARELERAFGALGIRPGGIVSNAVHGALDEGVDAWRRALVARLSGKARELAEGLRGSGFDPVPCAASFLATLRFERLGCDEQELAAALAGAGVGAQLGSRFSAPPGQPLIRVNFGVGAAALGRTIEGLRSASARLLRDGR